MRTLSKGKMAQFSKKQQKAEDIQQITNQVQAKCIARLVGISEEQIAQFKWFFDQLVKFKLPSNYSKRLSQKRTKILYFQRSSKQTCLIHPLINLIKTFFYESHKSNRSAFTFQNKKEKLLPYVQQKMMRNCISLNSKRREVEKLNLQKDQNGKNVLSKMARLKPNIKILVSARSYMLKMLVEKVYTCKQIWGKGKRARAYAGILNQKQKSNEEQQQNDRVAPEDLQTYQTIFTQAAKFYEQEYGDLTRIPEYILASQQFRNSTPQNVIRNMFILNISRNQIQYYWFARLMDCLKIPHNWSRQKGHDFKSYLYQPLKLNFDIHPSYIYIVLQMNRFKNYFNDLEECKKAFFYRERQMSFFDFFQRQYSVDMYSLALKEQLRSEVGGKELDPERMAQSNSNDWMIVEAIRNSQIQPCQYPVMGAFCSFWQSKVFAEQEWIPSVSPFGQVIWSSAVNYSSINYCPYRQALVTRIETQREKLPNLQKHHFKHNLRKDISVEQGNLSIQQQSSAALQLLKVSRERQSFLQFYLASTNDSQVLPYDVKHYDINDYFDQIFISPFQLDGTQINSDDRQQQETEVPLWLQKVRARRFSARIKNSINQNQDLSSLKQQLAKYALEMTARQEPHRLQQIQEQLRNIKSFDQLKLFTDSITNVEERQGRKIQYNQRFLQNAQNDDIFGSSQSNIDIQEAQALQSEEQFQQSVQEQQPESQDTQLQQNDLSSSDGQVSQQKDQKPQKQRSAQFNQQSPEKRQEYSFLKSIMHQKQYQKSPYFDDINDQTLDVLIKEKIKTKIKKHKYSDAYQKNTMKQHLKFKVQSRNQKQIKNIKKNLAITNFKYSSVPYKSKNIIKFNERSNADQFLKSKKMDEIRKIPNLKNTSQFQIIQKSDNFCMYESQMEDYSADQIRDTIRGLPKKQIVDQAVQIFEDLIQQEQIKPKKKQKPLIMLQPIKRIKPDISGDQRLLHINKVEAQGQIRRYKSIFQKKDQIPSESPLRIRIRRSNSTCNVLKSIQRPTQRFVSPLNSKHQKQLQFFDSVNSLTKGKLLDDTKQSTLFQSIQSFNRVCLGHMASSLLPSQPIRRKSELIIMDARKYLLHKGRGLETYISKKY